MDINMNLFKNNYLVVFLILAVFLTFSFPEITNAGRVAKAISSALRTVVAVVVAVAIVAVAVYLGPVGYKLIYGLAGGVVGSIAASYIDPTVTGCFLNGQVYNKYNSKDCGNEGGSTIVTPSVSGFTINLSSGDSCALTSLVNLNIRYSNISQVTKASINRDGKVIASNLTPPPTTYSDRNLPLQSQYVYQVIAELTDKSGAASNVLELKACPPAIDFKAPSPVEIPDSIGLHWITENADSLVASGRRGLGGKQI